MKYGSVSSSASLSRSRSPSRISPSTFRRRRMAAMVPIALRDHSRRVLAGGELFGDEFQRRLQIDGFDVRARGHHILDRNALQIEQVDQDAAVLFRDVVARLQYQRAQFLGGEALRLAACGRSDAQ